MICNDQNSNFKPSNISNNKQQSQLQKFDKKEASFKLACDALLHSNFGHEQNLNTFIDSLSKFDNTAAIKLIEIALNQFKIANSNDKLPRVVDKALVVALLFIKIAPDIAFTQSLSNLDQANFNNLAFNNWCKQELKLDDLPNSLPFSLTNRTDGPCIKFNLGADGPLDMPLATFLNENQHPKDNFMTTFNLKELTIDIDTIDIGLDSINAQANSSPDKKELCKGLSSELLTKREELQNKLADRIERALLKATDAHNKFKNLEQITQTKKNQVLIAIQSGQLDKYNDLLTINPVKLTQLSQQAKAQQENSMAVVTKQQSMTSQQLTKLSATKTAIDSMFLPEYVNDLSNSQATGKESLTPKDQEVRQALKVQIKTIIMELDTMKDTFAQGSAMEKEVKELSQTITHDFNNCEKGEEVHQSIKGRMDFIKPYIVLLKNFYTKINDLATKISSNGLAESLPLTHQQTTAIQDIHAELAANQMKLKSPSLPTNQHDFQQSLQQSQDLVTKKLINNENAINEIQIPKQLFHELVNTLQAIQSNEQILQLNNLKNTSNNFMAYSQLHNPSTQAKENDLMPPKRLLIEPQKEELTMLTIANETALLQDKVHDLLQNIFPEEIKQLKHITNDPEFAQTVAQTIPDTLDNKLSAIKQFLTNTINNSKTLINVCENYSSKDNLKSNAKNVLHYLKFEAKAQLAKTAKVIIKNNPEDYSSQGHSISSNGSVIQQEETAFNFNKDFKNNQGGIGNCYLIAFLNSAIFNSSQAQENIAQRVIVDPKDGSVTIKLNLIKEFCNQNGKLKGELRQKLDPAKFTSITATATDLLITISPEHLHNIANYGSLLQTLRTNLAISDPATASEDMLKALAQFAKQADNHLKKSPEFQVILSDIQKSKTISLESAMKLVKYSPFLAFFNRVTSSGIGFKLLESTLSSLASIESELRGVKDLNQSVLFFIDRSEGKNSGMDHVMYRLMGYNVAEHKHNKLKTPNEQGLQSKVGELEVHFANRNEITKPIATLGLRTHIITGRIGSHGSHAFSIVDIKKDAQGKMWLKLVNPWDSNQIARMTGEMKKGMTEEIKYGFEDYWSLDQLINKSNTNLNQDGNPDPGSIGVGIFSQLKN